MLLLRKQMQQLGWEIHLQQKALCMGRKSAGGLRMAVCVGNVGLDVKDRCSVHQVGAPDMKHRSEFCRVLEPQELHAGKGQVVGPKGGAGGKNPHSGVSAQPGGTNGRGPGAAHRTGKLPDEPQMAVFFDPPQRVVISKLRLKYDGRLQFLHKATLTGYAEFCGKIAFHMGNRLNFHLHDHRLPFRTQKVTANSMASSRLMAAPAEQPR